MNKKNILKYITAALLAVFMLTCFMPSAFAQKKLQKSPGGYHGELDFPISWKRYYSYAEWTKIMHDIQKKYSQLSDIESIGKSRMGRDQYLITITAKSTGDHNSKPAMWVDGAVHGNEINGVMCSLYIMWYLLTRYDYDPYIYDIVNNTTFYILPGLNVDGNDSFALFPIPRIIPGNLTDPRTTMVTGCMMRIRLKMWTVTVNSQPCISKIQKEASSFPRINAVLCRSSMRKKRFADSVE